MPILRFLSLLLLATPLFPAQAEPSKHTPESLGLTITKFPFPLWRIIVSLLKPVATPFEPFDVTAYTRREIIDIYFENDFRIEGNKLVIASAQSPAVTYQLKNGMWRLFTESHFGPFQVIKQRDDVNRIPWLQPLPDHALCATSPDGCLHAMVYNRFGGNKTVQIFQKNSKDLQKYHQLKEVIDQLKQENSTEKKDC